MKEASSEESSISDLKKRGRNLFALSILLSGLFLGSLFVDFFQLLNGEGFSSWATREHNVLETNGKTWVGYGDPLVKLQVVTDKSCISCDPSEALVWLRRVIPTIEVTRVDVADQLGMEMTERYNVVTLPAFIFSKDILHTSFYSQASSLFEKRNSSYFFDMGKIGLPAGRYLKLPAIGENDIVTGPENAAVTIVEFSDFECPQCKTFHKDLKQAAAPYGNQIRLVYKHLPLSFHAQAENAAMAAECANDQRKFDIYADYLFTKQTEWSKISGRQKFKDYAWWLKLDFRTFSTCLDSDQHTNKIAGDKEEAIALGINSTPATFINGVFLNGAVSANDIRRIIDQELAR